MNDLYEAISSAFEECNVTEHAPNQVFEININGTKIKIKSCNKIMQIIIKNTDNTYKYIKQGQSFKRLSKDIIILCDDRKLRLYLLHTSENPQLLNFSKEFFTHLKRNVEIEKSIKSIDFANIEFVGMICKAPPKQSAKRTTSKNYQVNYHEIDDFEDKCFYAKEGETYTISID